jgi:two-component system cell cycle sensor histidine kinase/response regulator CckA
MIFKWYSKKSSEKKNIDQNSIHEKEFMKHNFFDEEFFHSQKMNAIGNLTGGIAHDFNNLLTAILGFSELLLLKHPAGDPSFPELIQIRQNTIRASNLVSQLLAFSRKQILKPEFLNINNVLFGIFDLLKRLIGEEIEIEIDLNSKNDFAFLDRGQFEQIIINLVINAKDAINEFSQNKKLDYFNKKILIKSSEIFLNHIDDLSKILQINSDQLFSPEIYSDFSFKKNYLFIEIKDNGSGIEKHNFFKIFDPFFSTKKIGEGTGLGLSTVYGIVRQSLGYLFFKSNHYLSHKDNGTSFYILFESIPESKIHNQNQICDKNEIDLNYEIRNEEKIEINFFNHNDEKSILLIEDEDAVRQLLKITLESNGYVVFEARSSEDAIYLAKEKLLLEKKIDLLITDVILPGINGYEVSLKLKEKFKNIKTIFISGYAKEEVMNLISSLKEGEFLFLQKPFTLKKILDFVKKIFD